MQKIAGSISKQLDLEIRKMDTVSMNIAYSSLIKQHFVKVQDNEILKHENTKTLMEIFIAISGPLQTVKQINLYDFQGRMVGAGFLNASLAVDFSDKPVYEKVVKLDGRKIYFTPI